MEKHVNEELIVYVVGHYKPVCYEAELKKWYTAWGIEYTPEPGLTAQDLEKMGFKVVYAPKEPEWITLYDNYNEL